jgi:hypothetical protein
MQTLLDPEPLQVQLLFVPQLQVPPAQLHVGALSQQPL